MHYTLTSTRIEIIQGGKVIAFIEPLYFDTIRILRTYLITTNFNRKCHFLIIQII